MNYEDIIDISFNYWFLSSRRSDGFFIDDRSIGDIGNYDFVNGPEAALALSSKLTSGCNSSLPISPDHIRQVCWARTGGQANMSCLMAFLFTSVQYSNSSLWPTWHQFEFSNCYSFTTIKCYQVISLYACFNDNTLGKLWTSSMPYLFPFIVEYRSVTASHTFVCTKGWFSKLQSSRSPFLLPSRIISLFVKALKFTVSPFSLSSAMHLT